jgi:hypothetical protein
MGAVGAVGAVAVAQHLGRTWGSTPSERRQPLPGDDIVTAPDSQTTHAITIDAAPEAIWPWLVQMGYHRGGWYTYPWVDYPWVDRFVFRMSNPSADRVVPELQDVEVGDVIPDGPPGSAWYVVDALRPPHHLVLHSTSHDVPWRGRRGVHVDWTWAFCLEPATAGRSRLLVRVRIAAAPWWLRLVVAGAIVPADFVMSRAQLRGIRRRVLAARLEHPLRSWHP